MEEPGIKGVGFVHEMQHFHAAQSSTILHMLHEDCVGSDITEITLMKSLP